MENRNVQLKISEANKKRYSDGVIVDEYLQEKYHKVRIEVAVKFLINGIGKAFPKIPNSEISVIDIGCGNGTVSEIIAKLGYNVTAADFANSHHATKPEPLFFKKCFDASDVFPFPDNYFHCVFSGELIEHLFDTDLFLRECKRVLKPNGILILTTPNLAGFDDRIKFIFGESPRHVNPVHPYLKLHIRQFTKSSLKKILSKYGFFDIKIKSNFVKFYFPNNLKVQFRLLARVFPSLGGSLICFSKLSK